MVVQNVLSLTQSLDLSHTYHDCIDLTCIEIKRKREREKKKGREREIPVLLA